jgi:hypothetical protein
MKNEEADSTDIALHGGISQQTTFCCGPVIGDLD